MKFVLLLLTICSITLFGQADTPMDWNISINESGRIGVYHTQDVGSYSTSIIVDYGGQVYVKEITIESGEWGFANFPDDFGFSYQDMPESSGTIEANLAIQADGEIIYNQVILLTARNANQPYEVNVSEIANRINLYGAIIDDCIFWKDYAGYNYVIRSHTAGKGIYLSHWVMDVSGGTERINYYKSTQSCSGSNKLIQQHSIGWELEDANDDGFMEFYTFLKDGCVKTWEYPTDAHLLVFTNIKGLELSGRTYSLLQDAVDIGGDFQPNEALSRFPQILEQAKAAWEVYIME